MSLSSWVGSQPMMMANEWQYGTGNGRIKPENIYRMRCNFDLITSEVFDCPFGPFPSRLAFAPDNLVLKGRRDALPSGYLWIYLSICRWTTLLRRSIDVKFYRGCLVKIARRTSGRWECGRDNWIVLVRKYVNRQYFFALSSSSERNSWPTLLGINCIIMGGSTAAEVVIYLDEVKYTLEGHQFRNGIWQRVRVRIWCREIIMDMMTSLLRLRMKRESGWDQRPHQCRNNEWASRGKLYIRYKYQRNSLGMIRIQRASESGSCPVSQCLGWIYVTI